MRRDASKDARLKGPTVYLGGVPEEDMEPLIAEFAARRQARLARAAKHMGPPVAELNGPGKGKKAEG